MKRDHRLGCLRDRLRCQPAGTRGFYQQRTTKGDVVGLVCFLLLSWATSSWNLLVSCLSLKIKKQKTVTITVCCVCVLCVRGVVCDVRCVHDVCVICGVVCVCGGGVGVVSVYVCAFICHTVHVEVRGHLPRASSYLGFQVPNSSCQACTTRLLATEPSC